MRFGVACIAANCEDTLEKAIAPFLRFADDLVIVLGGYSKDRTAEVAKSLGEKVYQYDKHLLEDGSLANFADARQYSFSKLDTEWAVVVDSDDKWLGMSTIEKEIDSAIELGLSSISVIYEIGNLVFFQPRIFKISSGKWYGPVHEVFLTDTESLESNTLLISQDPGNPVRRQVRLKQNITIGEMHFAKNKKDFRVIVGLILDNVQLKHWDKVVELGKLYFEIEDRQSTLEIDAAVHLRLAISQLQLGNHYAGVAEILESLRVYPSSPAWSLLAETCYKMSNNNPTSGLLDLGIYSAERAMCSGRNLSVFAENPDTASFTPALLKGLCLAGKGNFEDAFGWVDLAVRLVNTPFAMEIWKKLRQDIKR